MPVGRGAGGRSPAMDSPAMGMGTPAYDAVLCDFDGVVNLRGPDGTTALDRSWGLAEGTLAAVAFEAGLLEAAVTGHLSDEQWRRRVAEGLAPVCGSAGRARVECADWAGGHRGRGPAGRAARYGAGGSGLQRHHASLAAVGLAEAFDAVVSSARIGVAKPDPRVFTTATGRGRTAPLPVRRRQPRQRHRGPDGGHGGPALPEHRSAAGGGGAAAGMSGSGPRTDRLSSPRSASRRPPACCTAS